MPDILRDSTVGWFINSITGGRLLPFADQKKGWQVPASYQLTTTVSETPTVTEDPNVDAEKHVSTVLKPVSGEDSLTVVRENIEEIPSEPQSTNVSLSSLERGEKGEEEKVDVDVNIAREDTIIEGVPATIIHWYDENDQDNPQNWTLRKKIYVLGMVSLLTFSVYIGSAIYTPSIPGVMERFQVSQTTATLGLALYVIGYGVGPLIFSPLSEVPSIGRTPVYVATLFIFTILQIPTIYAKNIQTLLAMRFFAGFFGSPVLATGGATIGDIFPVIKLPYALIAWSISGVCGPDLGPTMGGFAAQVKGWRWPLYELLWLSSFTTIVLMFTLPETNAETILLRRAQRLRKLTGNQNLHSESEIKQAQMKGSDILFEALLRPFQLMMEPAVFYVNTYLGFVYALFYLWFEAFPLVYNDIYHFNLGESGLPFLALLVSCFLSTAVYIWWNLYHVEPEFKRKGFIVPESRLGVALVASVFIPISLFMFGWSARASVHWIVPTIGAAFYLPGLYLLFQGVLVYLPISYPRYAASILAGNDLFRSIMGGCFPLFGRALYDRLTIGGGCSLLAGLSIALIPGLWILYKYGDRLRARSKYASS